jgi:hypothetical protein
MIVYVVVYDEPDEPSDVVGVYDRRVDADAVVDGSDMMYVSEQELQVGVV